MVLEWRGWMATSVVHVGDPKKLGLTFVEDEGDLELY